MNSQQYVVRQIQAVDVGLRRRQWLLICSRNLTGSRQKKNIVLLYQTKEIQDILQNIHTIYMMFISSRPFSVTQMHLQLSVKQKSTLIHCAEAS